MDEVEEVDDGQFQCGDGDVVVADCEDGVMVMAVGGVGVGVVCEEVGDLGVAKEEVDGVLGVGGEGEASGVKPHLVVGHGETGVLWAGAVGQRAVWAHPEGTLGQCHEGVGAQ